MYGSWGHLAPLLTVPISNCPSVISWAARRSYKPLSCDHFSSSCWVNITLVLCTTFNFGWDCAPVPAGPHASSLFLGSHSASGVFKKFVQDSLRFSNMFTSSRPSVTDVDKCGALSALKVVATSVNFFLLSRKNYDIWHRSYPVTPSLWCGYCLPNVGHYPPDNPLPLQILRPENKQYVSEPDPNTNPKLMPWVGNLDNNILL